MPASEARCQTPILYIASLESWTATHLFVFYSDFRPSKIVGGCRLLSGGKIADCSDDWVDVGAINNRAFICQLVSWSFFGKIRKKMNQHCSAHIPDESKNGK